MSRFEPAIPKSERPQTHGLDRVATGIDPSTYSRLYFLDINFKFTPNLHLGLPFGRVDKLPYGF